MPGRGQAEAAATRAVTYCVIPRELAPKLHDLLRRHFRGEPDLEVIVEQRARDRRAAPERRTVPTAQPHPAERRRILAESGRRVTERRAALVPIPAPQPLPRKAAPFAGRFLFAERLEPSSQALEDVDTARLVADIQ